MKKEQFKFNLQLFGNEGEPEPSENTPEIGTSQESQEQTSFTQKQVDEMIAEATKGLMTKDEVNDIVQKRLAQDRKNHKEEIKEAERLAQLSADDRAKEELKKEQAAFEEEKQAFERDKLELQVRKELGSQGLDENFAPFLMQTDAETSLENIKIFKAAFENAVEMGVKNQLRGTPPSAGGGGGKPKDAFSIISERYKK